MAFLLPRDTFGLSLDDIDEYYGALTEQTSPRRAQLWYLGQLIFAIPPFLNHSAYWSRLMLQNYLKLAVRHLWKAKLISSLHIAGLALSIACAIVMFLFIDLQYNMDSFHEHLDSIYLVEHTIQSGDQEQTWGTSPTPLGPSLLNDVPSVINAVRFDQVSGTMRYGDHVFSERISFADPSFFQVFSFPLQRGNPNSLSTPHQVILSSTLAEKYFGQRDPIGETITLTFNDNQPEAFVVGGVAEAFPHNASFRFAALVPYETLTRLGKDLSDWSETSRATFLQLDTPASANGVTEALASYLAQQQLADTERPMQSLLIQPLSDVPTKGFSVRGSITAKIFPTTALLFSVLAVLVLALACFNYINLALVAATCRMKEIGIRKVVGSSRGQLIGQFLGENLLMSVIALVAGVALAELLFIPGLNELLLGQVGFDLDYAANIDLWIFLGLILLFTGLIAGLYPAFYISSFQPTAILKGVFSVRGKSRFTRVLLTTQFIVSFVLLALGFANFQNVQRQENRDWGYDQTQTLVVPLNNERDYVSFRDAVASHPAVEQAAGAVNHIGRSQGSASIQIGPNSYDVAQFVIGTTYLETMALRLEAGRTFDATRTLDREAILVNETFIETVGWHPNDEPVLDRAVDIGGTTYTIIGVVKDFHYAPFITTIEPAILQFANDNALRYLALRIQAGQAAQVADFVEAIWRTQHPDLPYEGFFQDAIFDRYFQGMKRGSSLLTFISVIALLTSLMGLFGVVPLTLARRMKEISIRKMLGAQVWEVVLFMQREFATVLIVALVLGSTLSVFSVNALLTALSPYNEPASGWPFILAASLILGSAVLISLGWTYRRALTNPIDVIRRASE